MAMQIFQGIHGHVRFDDAERHDDGEEAVGGEKLPADRIRTLRTREEHHGTPALGLDVILQGVLLDPPVIHVFAGRRDHRGRPLSAGGVEPSQGS